MRAWSAEWQRRQYDAGWAGIDWPAEYGGRGLSFLKQIVWFEEYVQSGLPIGRSCFVVALAHAGPTLIARGSDEHKARVPPADPSRRGAVVPGLLRAGQRLRPGVAVDAGRDRRRRAGGQRPEGVDELRPPRRLPGTARAHRSFRAQAQGHHLGDLRHALAGHRGAPDPHDRRRRPLLRGVLRGRPHPAHQRRRRDRRGLERGDGDVGDRTRPGGPRLPARHAARHRRPRGRWPRSAGCCATTSSPCGWRTPAPRARRCAR